MDNPNITPPAIYGSLHELMKSVENVEKGGAITSGRRRYTFRKVDDLVQHVGEAARLFGIMLQSEISDCQYVENTVHENLWISCRLRIRYKFTSLKDGSSVVFEAIGEGRDDSDKASSKAMSMALKYALGQALLIPSGDPDPDETRPEVRQVKRDPQEAVSAAVQKAGEAKNIEDLERIRRHAEKIGIIDQDYMGLTLRKRLDNLVEAANTRMQLEEEKAVNELPEEAITHETD